MSLKCDVQPDGELLQLVETLARAFKVSEYIFLIVCFISFDIIISHVLLLLFCFHFKSIVSIRCHNL